MKKIVNYKLGFITTFGMLYIGLLFVNVILELILCFKTGTLNLSKVDFLDPIKPALGLAILKIFISFLFSKK
ncbi:hypothetical protein RYD26_12290 [Pasteurellaceae bacterium LIM206]|nr:hypothetical protein [Pasteurellaceae bacterium LIM206]